MPAESFSPFLSPGGLEESLQPLPLPPAQRGALILQEFSWAYSATSALLRGEEAIHSLRKLIPLWQLRENLVKELGMQRGELVIAERLGCQVCFSE